MSNREVTWEIYISKSLLSRALILMQQHETANSHLRFDVINSLLHASIENNPLCAIVLTPSPANFHFVKRQRKITNMVNISLFCY